AGPRVGFASSIGFESFVIGPVNADAHTFRISPEPSPRTICSCSTPLIFAIVSISVSVCSSGYRHASENASVIAFSAKDDGPYGFSFEFKRTSIDVATRDETDRDRISLGQAMAGRATILAAPTPNNFANRRRDSELSFDMTE